MMSRILLACVLFAAAALAQESAAIVGTVTDRSKGAVPSAKVTITEADTGFSRQAATDAQGDFTVASLRPARYNVSVEAGGFRTYIQKGIVLQANQSLTLNAELEIGAAAQSMTVSAGMSQVDTSTSTLNQVVDAARMVDMPLNGRNAASLTVLVAGALPIGGTANGVLQTSGISFPASVAISTNGSRANQTNYLLDGGVNNDGQTNVNQPFPFPDALQEFRFLRL